MNRLPWDCCRCLGKDCERRKECLRHEQLSNMGPRTPVSENLCLDWNNFIAIAALEK